MPRLSAPIRPHIVNNAPPHEPATYGEQLRITLKYSMRPMPDRSEPIEKKSIDIKM